MKRFSIRGKKLNRKKQVVIGGIVLLLFFGFFLIKNLLAMEYPLIVDGKGITQEEIRFHNHDIDRAIRSRVIFNWASKEGLADEFSYETFQKSLKTENKERKEIKQKGEPLYGPVEFTPMQYYKRQLGEYERRLKDHMMKRVEKKELYEFYKTHQENFKEVDTVCAEYTVRQDGREIYKESVILDKIFVQKWNSTRNLSTGFCCWRKEEKLSGVQRRGKKKNCIVQAGRMEGICPMRKYQEQCWNSTLQISLK